MIKLSDISLKAVDVGDSDRLIRWRNSDHIRTKMINSHVVQKEEHEMWLSTMLSDPSSQWSIVNYQKNIAGALYITHINPVDKTATWGMYVDKQYMSSVVGVLMEIIAIDKMIFDFEIRKIWGETLNTNKKLLAMHQKFGFEIEGTYREQLVRDNKKLDVYRIALFSEKWKMIRASLLATLGIE